MLDAVVVSLANRWNLISNPVTATNDSVKRLFPSSLNAYAYAFKSDSGYLQRSKLSNGVGYWEKFNSNQSVNVMGVLRNVDSIAVAPGWNLIGSVSHPVATSSILALGTALQSPFYGYSAGYQTEDTIESGRGYWVRVNSAGRLVFPSSSLVSPAALSRSGADVLINLNSLYIEDDKGNHQTLYFGKEDREGFESRQYELPPVPPMGIFDARFASQKMVETVERAKQRDIGILISSTTYPVRIHWNVKLLSTTTMLIIDGKQIPMNGNGEAEVSSARTQVAIRQSSAPGTTSPREFALGQNYPNPFNPSTEIRYALPVSARVSLKVYDLQGQVIATLVNGSQGAGYHIVRWESLQATSGIYFYRLDATDIGEQHKSFSMTRKMILIR